MPPFTHLVLPDLFLAEVVGHAQLALPNECCGLLAGFVLDGVGVVRDRYAVRNDAASARSFLTNPDDMLAAFRAMRDAGLELLAVYHSHPRGEPVPSGRDIEENTYGDAVVHLIVGLAGPSPQVRGWRFGRRGVTPVPVSGT